MSLPDTGSNDLILFKLERFRMSSSLTGTLPPTSPVFPPCGTTPILFSLQYLTILLTSSVVRGLSTVVEFPLYFPIQSSLNTVSSSAGVFEGESVDRIEEGARKLEKCARSSWVTEFRFGGTVVEAHLWCNKLEGALHADAWTKTRRRVTAMNMAGQGCGIESSAHKERYFAEAVLQRSATHPGINTFTPPRISRWIQLAQDPQHLHGNAQDGITARSRTFRCSLHQNAFQNSNVQKFPTANALLLPPSPRNNSDPALRHPRASCTAYLFHRGRATLQSSQLVRCSLTRG